MIAYLEAVLDLIHVQNGKKIDFLDLFKCGGPRLDTEYIYTYICKSICEKSTFFAL
jgi:hypothetical protein